MCLINWWSTIGLCLDIWGVLLLFKFGLPSKIVEEEYRVVGEAEDLKLIREAKNEHIRKMANRGLRLVIAGFAFQLIGSNTTFLAYLLDLCHC